MHIITASQIIDKANQLDINDNQATKLLFPNRFNRLSEYASFSETLKSTPPPKGSIPDLCNEIHGLLRRKAVQLYRITQRDDQPFTAQMAARPMLTHKADLEELLKALHSVQHEIETLPNKDIVAAKASALCAKAEDWLQASPNNQHLQIPLNEGWKFLLDYQQLYTTWGTGLNLGKASNEPHHVPPIDKLLLGWTHDIRESLDDIQPVMLRLDNPQTGTFIDINLPNLNLEASKLLSMTIGNGLTAEWRTATAIREFNTLGQTTSITENWEYIATAADAALAHAGISSPSKRESILQANALALNNRDLQPFIASFKAALPALAFARDLITLDNATKPEFYASASYPNMIASFLQYTGKALNIDIPSPSLPIATTTRQFAAQAQLLTAMAPKLTALREWLSTENSPTGLKPLTPQHRDELSESIRTLKILRQDKRVETSIQTLQTCMLEALSHPLRNDTLLLTPSMAR